MNFASSGSKVWSLHIGQPGGLVTNAVGRIQEGAKQPFAEPTPRRVYSPAESASPSSEVWLRGG